MHNRKQDKAVPSAEICQGRSPVSQTRLHGSGGSYERDGREGGRARCLTPPRGHRQPCLIFRIESTRRRCTPNDRRPHDKRSSWLCQASIKNGKGRECHESVCRLEAPHTQTSKLGLGPANRGPNSLPGLSQSQVCLAVGSWKDRTGDGVCLKRDTADTRDVLSSA